MLCFSLRTCEVFPQVPKVCNMPTAITLVCVISHFTHQYDSITSRTILAGGDSRKGMQSGASLLVPERHRLTLLTRFKSFVS